jgi:uncharacterized membrane protein
MEAYVFDQISGLPVHVLVVHAAVVFIPLLVLAAVVYALVPPLRARVGWVVFLLAIVAPLCAYVARESGLKFFPRKFGGQPPSPVLDLVNRHQHYGEQTFRFTVGLGLATLVLLVVARARGGGPLRLVVQGVVIVAVIGLAAASGYYVFKTGDTGARAVHG